MVNKRKVVVIGMIAATFFVKKHIKSRIFLIIYATLIKKTIIWHIK